MNESSIDVEAAFSIKNISNKQSVIEFPHVAPSKVLSIADGVELIEKGKVVKGNNFKIEGKLKLE